MISPNKNQLVVMTPSGAGGVSVIQVAGENAFTFFKKHFYSTKRLEWNNQIYYGNLYDRPEQGNIIDQILVRCFLQEDLPVIEICCHGGIAIVAAIADLFQSVGVERISPTVLLNHNLAVKGLVYSKTEFSAQLFAEQLDGAWEKYKSSLQEYNKEELQNSLDVFLQTFSLYKSLIEPQEIVIAGKPNSGKSTLLNQFVGRERVIVDDTPGTTRDAVRVLISLNGVPFYLCDTAGIRKSEDIVEKMGIEKARKMLEECERVIWVIDASLPPTEEKVPKHAVVLLNKVDLNASYINDYREKHPQSIPISAKTGEGIAAIGERFVSVSLPKYNAMITSEEMYRKVEEARILLVNGHELQARQHLCAF